MFFSYALYFAAALFVIGAVMILWAYVNPRWQSQDAYDALAPAIFGAYAVLASVIIAIVTGLIWRVRSIP